MTSLRERHETFRQLHQSGCFVIPNPFDIGSAKMMTALGARALATTSAGFAFTLGRPDMGHVTREEALTHAQDIVRATNLPVSGDLENGFGDTPDHVAETIRLAREAGLSGCSIEDTQMVEGNPAYAFDISVDRIKAAVDAARSLDDPFVLCARADGLMNRAYDLGEAVRRIEAFADAGADLLYIPILPDIESLAGLSASVSKPLNVLAAGPLAKHSVAELADAGARRISVGSQIARLTHAAILKSTKAMLDEGNFAPFADSANGNEINALLERGGVAGQG